MGQTEQEAAETALKFVEAINDRDTARLSQLLSTDHVLVDSLGTRLEGREAVVSAWQGYFSLFNTYKIAIQGNCSNQNLVLLHGWAAGSTANGAAWRIPAAWRALVRKGRIAEWQVYADNKPVYDLLAR